MTLKIALAQIGCMPDDPDGTLDRVIDACREAAARKADIVLFPEAAVQGPCPEGLPGRLLTALADLPDLAVVLGCAGGGSVLHGGRELARLHDGADEPRCFALAGVTVAVLFPDEFFAIADGIAAAAPTESAVAVLAPRLTGAGLLLVPAAWPAWIDELESREDVLSDVATRLRLPLLCATAVGGDDRLRFGGGSFALDAFGRQQARLALGSPDLALIELDPAGREDDRQLAVRRGPVAPLLAPEAQWDCLLTALLRERLPARALVVDDGCIGAAILRVLCAEVLGAASVQRLAPGADESPEAARAPVMTSAARLLLPFDRSRLACGPRLPTAGWAGVPTLDPPLAPLGALYRGEVVRLARWLVEQGRADIPRDLLLRSRADLSDPAAQPLPPCDIVDEILRLELDLGEAQSRILARGYAPDAVMRILVAARRAGTQTSSAFVVAGWRRRQLEEVKAE